MNTVEFRDAGGGYVLALPFDDVRCRVVASNLLEKNLVLFKDPELSWEEASEDLGGFTRLDPCEFAMGEADDPRERSLLGVLEEAALFSARTTDDFVPGPERIPDPASLRDLADGDDAPRALVARLAAHYVTVHRDRIESVPPKDICRCPGFRIGNSRSEARLHAMVAVATAAQTHLDPRKRSRKAVLAA